MGGKEKPSRIVIDSNIIISALLKDNSHKGALIRNPGLSLFYPEYGLTEIERYSEYIKEKREKKEQLIEFSYVMETLLKQITIIPDELYKGFNPQAYEIMKDIDEKDTPFLALALYLDVPIWSDDKHLHKQNIVRSLYTEDIISLSFSWIDY